VKQTCTLKRVFAALTAVAMQLGCTAQTSAYAFNMTVPDVRQPASVSGGSACPVPARQLTAAGSIALRWSTALGSNPATILTQAQTAAAQLAELQLVIATALSVWTGVSGTTLSPTALAPVSQTTTASACGTDGINSLCFNQADMAFTPGVLAFTRVVTADVIGEQLGGSAVSVQPGQILDADIYFNPGDPMITFATPPALPASPKSYDLESILTHELGHFFGFSHSAIWSAMMFPYARVPGTYASPRPSAQQPDAPLGDDDRTGLRVLYPDPSDTVHTGAIQGHVLPANPISLPVAPPGVTGIFGAQVVAVNAASGSVAAGTIGGWSCSLPGPTQFDGSFAIAKLAVGQSYLVYAEPLNGAVESTEIDNAISTLCRNTSTDAGWPPLLSCMVPPVDSGFTVRTWPGP